MAFENFLSQFGIPAMGQAVPGFAGGMFPIDGSPMIEGMGGLEEALAQNQAMRPPRQNPRAGRGIGHVLGLIGETLARARGLPAFYSQELEQRQRNEAMRNFLTDPEGAIEALMQVDPAAGIQLYQSRQGKTPEIITEMRMAGIDPQSEEGRAILKSRLMGRQGSSFARELQDFGFSPEEAKSIARRRYTRPIIVGSAATGYGVLNEEDEGGAPEMGGGEAPIVNSQEEYDALPNGAPYRDSQGNLGVKRGGPTPQASGGFL